MTTREERERAIRREAEARLHGCLASLLLGPGTLAGLTTLRDCMKDENLRPFFGHALLHEILPSMGLGREVLDPAAMAVCRELEEPAVTQPLSLLLNNGVRAWEAQALPLLVAYQDREDALPPCLCMSLAALVMLFAGVRREENGRYGLIKNGEPCYVNEDEELLDSFSRLACDMPPETLAYAALSDRAIWQTDLRDIPGLEEQITGQLRDLQLLGLMEALAKAWKNHQE